MSTSSASSSTVGRTGGQRSLGSRFRDRCISDFEFRVGGKGERFKCHKSFLEMRSTELGKEVVTAWKKKDSSSPSSSTDNIPHILLPDFDERVFFIFFEYLYTDEFIPTLGFTKEDFTMLIKLFDRYCGDEMPEILGKLVALNNVYKLAKIAVTSKNKELEKLTSDYIEDVNKNAELFLEADDFLHMDCESVSEMIKSDDFDIKELALFNAVLKWANKQLEIRPPGSHPKTLREQMELVLPHIRFPLLSHTEIVRFVHPHGILTNDEFIQLMVYLGADEAKKAEFDTFTTKPRTNASQQPQVTNVMSLSANGHSLSLPSISRSSRRPRLRFDGEDSDSGGELNGGVGIDIEPGVKSEVSGSQTPRAATPTPTLDSGSPSPRRSLRPTSTVVPSPVVPASASLVSNGGNGRLFEDSDSDSSGSAQSFNVTIKKATWKSFLKKVEENKNCPNITGIVKDGRILTSYRIPKIEMPNLETILLDCTIPVNLEPEDDEELNELNEVIQLRRNFDLKPYVFFKTRLGQENYDPLFDQSHPVNFQLVINNVKFFKLNRINKEAMIGFGGASTQIFPLLANTARQFEKLILSDMDLPSAPIPCESFKELMLWGVRDTTPSSLGSFLQKFENLEQFSCWTKRRHREEDDIPDKSTIDLGRDLVSGDKLIKMSVCYGKFTLQSPYLLENVRKENLTELYTDASHWSPVIFEIFHEIFPSLKRVAFGYCGRSFTEDAPQETEESGRGRAKRPKLVKPEQLVASVSVRLMTNLLKIKSIAYIRIRQVDWSAKPMVPKEKNDIIKFLENAGLTGLKHLPYNFVLEKKSGLSGPNRKSAWKSTSFNDRELEPEDGDGLYWDEMDRLEYKFFGLSRIFNTFKAFQDYNVEPTYYA